MSAGATGAWSGQGESGAPWLRLVAQAVLGVAVGVAASVVVGRTAEIVQAAGRNLPLTDRVTDYVIGAVWSIAIGLAIAYFPLPQRERFLFLAAWAGRCFVTLGFMLYYEYIYDFLDAYGYFDASRWRSPPVTLPLLGAGTENVELLTWLHGQVVPSYHAMKVTFSFIGLVAAYLLYRAASLAIGVRRPAIFLVLAFFPSILFWSSILGKDPLVLLGIATYAYGVVRWHVRGGYPALLIVGLGIVLAMLIRLWLGPILAAPFAVLWLLRLRSPRMRWGFALGGALVGAGLLWRYRVELLQETLTEVLSTVNTVSRGWSEGGSAQQLATEFSSPGAVLAFLPRGMFTALFRPLPGEVMNAFGLLAGLENLLLLLLLAVACWRTRWRELREPLVAWALSLVLVWAIVYSVISYQNLGTAVRFRLQVLPIMLGLLAWLARPRPAAHSRSTP